MIKNFISYIKKIFLCLNEGYRLKDKIILLLYFIQTPLFLIYFLTGKRHNYKLLFNVKIKNNGGIFFCEKDIWNIYTALSNYEPLVKKYLVIKKGVFVDIGANIGIYTVINSKNLGPKGEVISIEAGKENFKILEKNIKLNNLDNVITINKGCFSKKGELDLNLAEFGTGGHSLIKKSSKKEKIKVDTLDNILLQLKMKKVDLIKIDVEGAEIQVIKGAIKTLKKFHPKIVFEILEENSLEKIKKILNEFNYKVKKIDEENYFAY